MNKVTDAQPDPRRLDLQQLADVAATLEGQWPLLDLPRLSADAVPAGDGQARWSVAVERRAVVAGTADPCLHLNASATVHLVCQRCLQPVEQVLTVDRRFRFVAGEAQAERQDEEADDEDVLALPPRSRLDLQPLVEDELILALPLVPRHDECPEPLLQPDSAEAEAPAAHPFAALAALKKGRG